MKSYAVTILLNVTTHAEARDAGTAGCCGFSPGHADSLAIFLRVADDPKAAPGDKFRPAGNFVVDAADPKDAADRVFAIGNGASDQSARYYAQKVRSISVGDAVRVETPDGPVTFVCEDFGWSEVDAGIFQILDKEEVAK